MASSCEASIPWMAPGSPSKSTLQRGNVTAKHTRDASPSSPRKGEPRSRQMSSPVSPGKENFPILGETRGRTEAKPAKMSFFRGKSPERRGNSEAKPRSVSPTKRDKNQLRDDERGLQCDRQSLIPRSPREIDTDFVNMLVSALPWKQVELLNSLSPLTERDGSTIGTQAEAHDDGTKSKGINVKRTSYPELSISISCHIEQDKSANLGQVSKE